MSDFLSMPPDLLAHVLFEQGYFPVSCRYEAVARIDRADWKDFMVQQGYDRARIDRPETRLGEQYARVYSKDSMDRIGRNAYRKLRNLWAGRDAEFKELPK